MGCSASLVCPLVADIFVLAGKSYKALLEVPTDKAKLLAQFLVTARMEPGDPSYNVAFREFTGKRERERGNETLRAFLLIVKSSLFINCRGTFYWGASIITVVITVLVTSMYMGAYLARYG